MIGIGLVETVEHPFPRPYLQLQQPISVPLLMELRFEVFEIIDLLVVCDYLCLVNLPLDCEPIEQYFSSMLCFLEIFSDGHSG